MTQTATGRVEIDFSVYNPFDEGFVRDPFPQFSRLLEEYPVAFHTGLNAWVVAPHDLVADILRSPRFSLQFSDWKDAPPRKPESEWNLYEQVQARGLATASPAEHLRLRRLTAPGFSPPGMVPVEDPIAR